METLFSTALSFRNVLSEKLTLLDDGTLDTIPDGFEASIRWHVAHMIVTPLLVTYERVGVTCPLVSQEFLTSARSGTSHENFSLNEDYGIKHLSEFLIETIKQLQRDVKDLEQNPYESYESSMGYLIKDMPSALAYSVIHDGIHIGMIRSILKAAGPAS